MGDSVAECWIERDEVFLLVSKWGYLNLFVYFGVDLYTFIWLLF